MEQRARRDGVESVGSEKGRRRVVSPIVAKRVCLEAEKKQTLLESPLYIISFYYFLGPNSSYIRLWLKT